MQADEDDREEEFIASPMPANVAAMDAPDDDVLVQLQSQVQDLQLQHQHQPPPQLLPPQAVAPVVQAPEPKPKPEPVRPLSQSYKKEPAPLQPLGRREEVLALAAEALAKNYALKLDVVKQIEDFEIARREYYDHKRESNAMYWMAFTLVMKRSKSENTRYLDFFSRKVAAENTYVRCILEMKEESEKLKHGAGGHKSHLETAFGEAKKNLLDDLLGVQEQMAEQVHAFGKVIEAQIVPSLEEMITTFNASVETILKDGEEYLEDIELAEGNVQQASREYRDQAEALEKLGMAEQDLWVYEMHYRVAVGVLQETWGVCSKGLGSLFTRMKDTEMARRQAIHAALQTLHDQQTAYWKKLPELGQTLSTLVQTRVADPHLIEKEIGTDIRAGAQRLEHSEEGRRRKAQIMANRPQRRFTPTPPASAANALGVTSILSTTLDSALPPAVAVGPSGGQRKKAPKEFAQVLKGPLSSPLIMRAQLFERKSTNVFKPWKPVLAILTVDNYLHVFDLPAFKGTAEESFEALIAKPESLARALGQTISAHTTMVFPDKEAGKKTLGMVSPHLTFNLAHCEAHYKAAALARDTSFEVVEHPAGNTHKTIKKVFKDLGTRKVTFKGKSKEEMATWCKLVDNVGLAAFAAVVGAK